MDKNRLYTSRLDEHIAKAKDECRWLEFKSNYIDPERMGKYISAMSNGACLDRQDNAYLYFGVEDGTLEIKGTIFNMQHEKKGNQALELYLRQLVSPKINFSVDEFLYNGITRVVVVKIPAAVSEPTLFAGKAWVRVDSHVTDLMAYTNWVRAIYNSRADWTAEIVENATLDDLDSDAIRLAREGFAKRFPDFAEASKEWPDDVFLDKAELTRDGEITRATLLLIGKKESAHKLEHIAQLVWKVVDSKDEIGDIYTIPFIKNTTELMGRIRNYRFKIYPKNTLIPAEVWKYDTRSILEGLHNCIAHQDYVMDERVVVEEDNDKLTFKNAGDFYAGDYRQYIYGKITPTKYRNPFLVKAMVNVKMIDTRGYGIHNMFERQKERYLPMPDYKGTDDSHVVMHLPGTVIDENYSVMLINYNQMSLKEAVLLDQVQRGHRISDDAIALLRKKHYIEGRKPNIFVAKPLAKATGKENEYSKHKGLDDKSCEMLVIDELKKRKVLSRGKIDEILWDVLSDQLSDQQKKTKIGNVLRKLRERGMIMNSTRGNISEYTLVKDS